MNLEETQLDDIIESQKNKNMSSKVGIAYKQFEKRVKTEGATEKTILVVRKGWQKNYPISEIADLAEISVQEVQKLIAQFEKENKPL